MFNDLEMCAPLFTVVHKYGKVNRYITQSNVNYIQ